MIKIQKFLAKSISYSPIKRKLNNILYIAIHNTGNRNDTAWNNAKYFANSNTRQAGAHFFVDQSGNVVLSIEMDRTAWAVGGFVTSANGAASYYKKCTNANSVSIELCDIVDKAPSDKMIKATLELIEYIQTNCPNAKTIIRHYDVSGKSCPMQFVDNTKWTDLLKKIDPAQQNPYGDKLADKKLVMLKDSYLRTSPEIKNNKVAYSALSDAMKKRCRNKDGYAVINKGSTFIRIRSYKDKEGNKWKQTKSGQFWVPYYYKGEKRAEEA